MDIEVLCCHLFAHPGLRVFQFILGSLLITCVLSSGLLMRKAESDIFKLYTLPDSPSAKVIVLPVRRISNPLTAKPYSWPLSLPPSPHSTYLHSQSPKRDSKGRSRLLALFLSLETAQTTQNWDFFWTAFHSVLFCLAWFVFRFALCRRILLLNIYLHCVVWHYQTRRQKSCFYFYGLENEVVVACFVPTTGRVCDVFCLFPCLTR